MRGDSCPRTWHRSSPEGLTMSKPSPPTPFSVRRTSIEMSPSLLGACQLIKRTLFDEIGGFDERSLICSSDDIICLEAQRRGFRNLYTPYAALIHHESITRGRDDPGVGEDRVLLAQELDRLDYQEDPFFHPELDPRWLTPTLRPEWVPTSRECLRQRIEGLTILLPKHDTSLHHTRPSLQAFLNGLDSSSHRRSLVRGAGWPRYRGGNLVRDRYPSPG